MTSLFSLWLPIILSAVVVFIASTIIHMLLPWHKNDYLKIPEEDKVLNALRPFKIPPGDYMAPRVSKREDLRSPEFLEKMDKGPVMVLTVRPNGMWKMGSTMFLWFVYSLMVSLFSAYITSRALPEGAHYLQVFRFIGASAFMGYSFALWQMYIWYGRSLTTTLKAAIDGLIYALLTAAVFGRLWPG